MWLGIDDRGVAREVVKAITVGTGLQCLDHCRGTGIGVRPVGSSLVGLPSL